MAQSIKSTDQPVIHELQHAVTQYRIITADEDIIQRTGEQIVQACKLQMNVSAWRQNFNACVNHVHDWCKANAPKVSLALVNLRSDKIVFYIIPTSEQYDFELGEIQADLDIYLNTRGAIGYTETRQIPGWEIERFAAPTALRVYPRDEK